MMLDVVPARLKQKYRFREWRHALAVLSSDFPDEWRDLLACLDQFVLRRSYILEPGRGRSPIPKAIDGFCIAGCAGGLSPFPASSFFVTMGGR